MVGFTKCFSQRSQKSPIPFYKRKLGTWKSKCSSSIEWPTHSGLPRIFPVSALKAPCPGNPQFQANQDSWLPFFSMVSNGRLRAQTSDSWLQILYALPCSMASWTFSKFNDLAGQALSTLWISPLGHLASSWSTIPQKHVLKEYEVFILT